MKTILLVLDALGVGAMPDVATERPQDRGANTLRSLVKNVPDLRLENLLRLGLGHIAPEMRLEPPAAPPLASYGRCRLAHPGADSYLGHQEIAGTIPKPPVRTLMAQAAGELEGLLAAKGYTVRRPLPGKNLLLVEEALVIGDNLEADPGLNINLTVATDLIDFERALEIGKIVRQSVRVSRVIVFGGPGIDTRDILRHVLQPGNGQIGIDSPAVGVYNEKLRVQHLGYGVDPDRQAPTILSRAGFPVCLIGKMADLVTCPEAARDPLVPTAQVMQAVLDASLSLPDGLIAATVQETDLAAHEGDSARLANVLQTVDQGLEVILANLEAEDILIICADHGNDPLVNIGRHTREETPLLIYQKNTSPAVLGLRQTLADIGATITHLYGLAPTQDGQVIQFRSSL